METLIETPADATFTHPAASQGRTPLALSTDQSPMALAVAALERNVDLDKLRQFMDLQQQWERQEAEKAYNAAFAQFKATAVKIIRNRAVTDGPLKGKSYAELFAVVNAVTPELSNHGLSAAWSVTRDEPEWIAVTCTLKHVGGHSESVTLGGPPDAGGAKNRIQARASTVTYLQRYTLKAILGLSEQDDDTDGNTGSAGAAAAAPEPPAEQPAWPADKWARALPKMVAGIKAGKTIEQALAWLRAKGRVTREQEAELRAASAPDSVVHLKPAAMASSAVMNRINAAATVEALDEAALPIGLVAEAAERQALEARYSERRTNLINNEIPE